MSDTETHILTINGGSSSIKFCAFTHGTFSKILEGKMDRIGMEGTLLSLTNCATGEKTKTLITVDEHEVHALLIDIIEAHISPNSLSLIGHRFVHGGTKYFAPTRIDTGVLDELTRLSSFAPRHLPAEIALAQAFLQRFPKTPQYACFDTGFFHDIPRNAQILALPRKYEAEGVRRYGFHGLSYESLLNTLATTLHESLQSKKIVLAHLGSGASLAAVENGKPIDMTMGFTPTSGIPMGTRSGDLDPGLFEYFTKTGGLSVDEFSHMVNYESGLKGVSGTTADMEVLLTEAPTDPHAEEAVAFFCYQVQKSIAALAATMGGLDILVFAGGIGESSAEIRKRICARLGFLGIAIDDTANKRYATCISNTTSRVTLYMIPTNEESMIAQHTALAYTKENS